MLSLKDQLLKNGLINQQQIDTHQEQKKNEAAEKQRQSENPVAGNFTVQSGKVVFGSYWNIAHSAAHLDSPPATHWPQVDSSGTALSKSHVHWADAENGNWTVYRVQSKKALQAYFVCHDGIDALKTYFKLGKLAPMNTNVTTEQMYQKGVIVVHRYDWDYEHAFFENKQSPDYECQGQECFFIEPASLPLVESFLNEEPILDKHPFLPFDHGCGFTFRDSEYSFARLNMDKNTKKLNAFLFYTDQSSLRGAKIKKP